MWRRAIRRCRGGRSANRPPIAAAMVAPFAPGGADAVGAMLDRDGAFAERLPIKADILPRRIIGWRRQFRKPSDRAGKLVIQRGRIGPHHLEQDAARSSRH